MSEKRTSELLVQDILDASKDIIEYTAEMEFEDFTKDKKTIQASVYNLLVIGEAAKRVSIEIREEYPHVNWKGMAGMRDVIIHNYSGIQLEIVWKTIKEEIPPLVATLVKILKILRKK